MEKMVGGYDSGVLVVDKPGDISSAAVTARVKKLLGVKKIGHTGTLDPFATGVMILCLNQATRLSRFFLHSQKTYEATLTLGATTDTQDATGQVIFQAPAEAVRFSKADIQAALAQFEGDIEQIPPVYSALKHKGTPLYKLARQGRPVQKEARQVTIHNIQMTDLALPDVNFTVTCSAGTYIRTLCNDIGQVLGCGGHLSALRRIKSSGFGIDQAVSLPELAGLAEINRAWERVIHKTDALPGIPMFKADSTLASRIRHGMPLTADDVPPETAGHDGMVKITDLRRPDRLLAVAQWQLNPHGVEGGKGKYQYFCVFHYDD